MLRPGDRVKYSAAACDTLRQGWLSAGSYESKTRARKWLDEKLAKRGTIREICENKFSKFYRIDWDSNYVSETALYLVEAAEASLDSIETENA